MPSDMHARAARINDELGRRFPDARCELNYANPLQLLVATVLSAQCTDKRVNDVTPPLFAAYPNAADYAAANPDDVESLIRPTGFFRNKTTAIIGIGRVLTDQFNGQVPHTLDELVSLPGVGRKTANVVLGNAFDIPGITVDTHVGRIARRLGWSTSTDPVVVERDIAALFPPADWTMLCHRLIFLGRRICHSRVPACGACPIAADCPSFGIGPTDPDIAKAKVTG